MDVSDPFNRHGLHFFDVVRPRFSSQIFWVSVTLFVFFEQKPGLVERFRRIFRNRLGFDDLKRVFFSLSLLLFELVFSDKFASLLNSLPNGKVGQGVENALNPVAMSGFFWISWADKSDPDLLNALLICRKEEWLF
jgi:hypothetical protein